MPFAVRTAAAAALFIIAFASNANAATFKTIYDFCPDQDTCSDGSSPVAVVADADGNLYGTTFDLGAFNNGTIFSLTHNDARTAWTYKTLYSFCADFPTCPDGREPIGNLILGTDGTIYGTTSAGGTAINGGTVFALKPNKKHTKWTYSVLYAFCPGAQCTDGMVPDGGLSYVGEASGQFYDGSSTLFGETGEGGKNESGVAFQLTKKHGGWAEKVIHDFCSGTCKDGAAPSGALLPTSANSLVGVANGGGALNGGTAFQLNLNGGKWKSQTLLAFNGSSPNHTGSGPTDGVTMTSGGSFIGTTYHGSGEGKGVLYALANGAPDGPETVLYAFCQEGGTTCTDGALPFGAPPVADASGHIFGTTTQGGGHNDPFSSTGAGIVYEFDGTDLTVIHAFCSAANCTDGDDPLGLIKTGVGTMYGVTSAGGANGHGLIFELTP